MGLTESQQVKRSLSHKLRAERHISAAVGRFLKDIERAISEEWIENGVQKRSLNTDETLRLQSIMARQYWDIGKYWIGESLEERKSLRSFLNSVARIYGNLINHQSTLSDDGINNALSSSASTANDDGYSPSAQRNIFRRFASGLKKRIATTGAGWGVETIKGVLVSEARRDIASLSSLPKRILDRLPSAIKDPSIKKRWHTTGDSIVRTSHNIANRQTVSVGDPFVLTGGLLKYPGDGSLGASLGEIINCRCSAVIVGGDQ